MKRKNALKILIIVLFLSILTNVGIFAKYGELLFIKEKVILEEKSEEGKYKIRITLKEVDFYNSTQVVEIWKYLYEPMDGVDVIVFNIFIDNGKKTVDSSNFSFESSEDIMKVIVKSVNNVDEYII